MGGITMWIILGGLIGLVIIFLVVTSILDKNKRKRIVAEKKGMDSKVKSSSAEVCFKVNKIIKINEKELKEFVPSVGNKKMSDINNKAKNSLITIKNSGTFKLLKHNVEEDKLFTKHISKLISEKSNNWSKRNIENIEFFKKYKPKLEEQNTLGKKKKGKK